MYQVFDNGRPADVTSFPTMKSWTKSTFKHFKQAVNYARNWLGEYANSLPEHCQPNTEYQYSYAGDKIEIRKV